MFFFFVANLCEGHHSVGNFKTAVEYHERALRIAKELGDRSGERNEYCRLGIVHHSMGNFKISIDYTERGLNVAKELGNRSVEGKAYGNLGNAHRSLGDFEKAPKITINLI